MRVLSEFTNGRTKKVNHKSARLSFDGEAFSNSGSSTAFPSPPSSSDRLLYMVSNLSLSSEVFYSTVTVRNFMFSVISTHYLTPGEGVVTRLSSDAAWIVGENNSPEEGSFRFVGMEIE